MCAWPCDNDIQRELLLFDQSDHLHRQAGNLVRIIIIIIIIIITIGHAIKSVLLQSHSMIE